MMNDMTIRVANALRNYNKSEKGTRQKIKLKGELLSILSEVEDITIEGEKVLLDDNDLKTMVEYIDDIITMDGDIPTHITAVFSSDSIGFQILGDEYAPQIRQE